MSSFLGLSATEILQDKHLLFALSSTIMFLVFSYPPLVKTSTRLITNITHNFIPKTFAEMSILMTYSFLFGLSVYIFARFIFDKLINTVVRMIPPNTRNNSTPPNTRNNSTPPNTRNNSTPPNTRNNSTPPNTRNNSTPPNTR